MYRYFSFLVSDMMADVTIEVLTLTGETDVLVSNTREFPNLGTPADVQWKSDWVNLDGNVHRIRSKCECRTGVVFEVLAVRYEDPLFLIGSYHLAVFGRQNATFEVNVTVEQVAREIEFGRSYGSTLSTGSNCSLDSDCGETCSDVSMMAELRMRTRVTMSMSNLLVIGGMEGGMDMEEVKRDRGWGRG
eukprot:766403-Hanusia_phi.AAC.1